MCSNHGLPDGVAPAAGRGGSHLELLLSVSGAKRALAAFDRCDAGVLCVLTLTVSPTELRSVMPSCLADKLSLTEMLVGGGRVERLASLAAVAVRFSIWGCNFVGCDVSCRAKELPRPPRPEGLCRAQDRLPMLRCTFVATS
mmetsp:Transcript_143540/g.250315  ORF Transcript_143540/g.250315 Transcript_143540/m.250315 type:complete len:142 (+) Transcript_143540:15-440(+)